MCFIIKYNNISHSTIFIIFLEYLNQEGQSFINAACTMRATCRNGELIENNHQCSEDAICDERNGTRGCFCKDGFEGDGEVCTRMGPRSDCYDLYISGVTTNNVYTIYPAGWPDGFQVYCEMETNGGGWTVSWILNNSL